MTPADILDRAADLIEVGGLMKGRSSDGMGRYCAYGAIGRAAMRDQGAGNYLAALDALAVEVSGAPKRWERITRWNDAVERSKYEVVDAMRRAAKNLRNEETINDQ